MDSSQFQNLVRQLASLSRETEWLELKHNNTDPYEAGEYISALSNAATILGKPQGAEVGVGKSASYLPFWA